MAPGFTPEAQGEVPTGICVHSPVSTSRLFTCLRIMHEIHVQKKLRNTGKYEEERNITHNPATRSCPRVQPCLLRALPCTCSCMPWWHALHERDKPHPGSGPDGSHSNNCDIFLPESKCTSDILFTGCVILEVWRDPTLISKSPVGVEII